MNTTATRTQTDPALNEFKNDVLAGLAQTPKQLPCKYFYDATGSRLFEAICELDAYYVTRTEIELLPEVVAEVAPYIDQNACIIEPGSGAGTKIRLMLDALDNPACYAPVEISETALERATAELQADFPTLAIHPVTGDFDATFAQPQRFDDLPGHKKVVFFPGSTIGNFKPKQAQDFLKKLARCVGQGGGLLMGYDLIKDRDVLINAYDDPEGITAKFNKNILARINRELDGDITLDDFSHRAVYNEMQDRIEMHLVSQKHQAIVIDEQRFELQKHEFIHTENSHKYTLDSMTALAASAGFDAVQHWRDDNHWFAISYFTCSTTD